MTLVRCWAHGDGTTTESPESLEDGGTVHGWGLAVEMRRGQGGWFHLPVPAPIAATKFPVVLQRVFLLFETSPATTLRRVHVYDGPYLVEAFEDMNRSEDHRFKVAPANTFELTEAHAVKFGLSISFFILGATSLSVHGAAPRRLIVSAGGAEYETTGGLASRLTETIANLLRWRP